MDRKEIDAIYNRMEELREEYNNLVQAAYDFAEEKERERNEMYISDNRKIETFPISTRLYNILKRQGVNTAGDVARMYFDGTLLRGIGVTYYDELVGRFKLPARY